MELIQTGSGVHPASYPMGMGGSFSGGKMLRLRMCGTIPPLIHMPSWWGAWLSRSCIFMVWYLVRPTDNITLP